MLDFILRFVFNSIGFAIFIYFIHKSIGLKTIKFYNIVILTCLFLLKTYILDYNIPILNLLNTLILNIYILTMTYGTITKRLWLLIVFMALSILSEEVGLFVNESFLSQIFKPNVSFIICFILSKGFLLLFLSIIIMLFKVVEYENIQYQHILILLTFPIASILTLVSIRYPIYIYKQNVLLLCSVLALMIANIGCFYEYYMLAKSRSVKIENEIMKGHLENNEKYIALHKRKMEKDRAFIHDIKKHIAYIQGLVMENKNEEVLDYIHQYLYDIELKRDIITGNESFDIALSLYMNEIIDHRIKIDFSGVQSVDLSWIDPKDLNSIFSNLIENAVEASYNVENPNIVFSLKEADKKVVFRISNICNISVLGKSNKRTTKLDVDSHGYGLKNVTSCVNKYGAILTSEIDKTSSKYVVTILFQKP